MGSLNVSLSGAKILGNVARGRLMTVPELASELRLTPTKIRSNLIEFEQKGWTHLEDDHIVHITPQGKDAYAFITLHPDLIGEPLERTMETEIDLDAALEKVLRPNQAAQSGNTMATPEQDNNQGSSSHDS